MPIAALAVPSPPPSHSGVPGSWLTRSLVTVAGIDEYGRRTVSRDLFAIPRSGLQQMEGSLGLSFDDARRLARRRAIADAQGCAQAVLRARDGSWWVSAIGARLQSGSYAASLDDGAAGGRSVQLRVVHPDVRAVVGRNGWVDFTGTPKPHPETLVGV